MTTDVEDFTPYWALYTVIDGTIEELLSTHLKSKGMEPEFDFVYHALVDLSWYLEAALELIAGREQSLEERKAQTYVLSEEERDALKRWTARAKHLRDQHMNIIGPENVVTKLLTGAILDRISRDD
jgi:hypothetical protein